VIIIADFPRQCYMNPCSKVKIVRPTTIALERIVAWMRNVFHILNAKKTIAWSIGIVTAMNAAWTVGAILNMIVEKNAVMILTVVLRTVVQRVGDADPPINAKANNVLQQIIALKISAVLSMDIVEQIPSFATICLPAMLTMIVMLKNAVQTLAIVD